MAVHRLRALSHSVNVRYEKFLDRQQLAQTHPPRTSAFRPRKFHRHITPAIEFHLRNHRKIPTHPTPRRRQHPRQTFSFLHPLPQRHPRLKRIQRRQRSDTAIQSPLTSIPHSNHASKHIASSAKEYLEGSNCSLCQIERKSLNRPRGGILYRLCRTQTVDEKKALHCCKALSIWLPDLDSNQRPAD